MQHRLGIELESLQIDIAKIHGIIENDRENHRTEQYAFKLPVLACATSSVMRSCKRTSFRGEESHMRLAALAGAAAPAMAASAAASAAIARRREGTLARTFSPSACSLSLAPCTARIAT